jgi:hypothetical protein
VNISAIVLPAIATSDVLAIDGLQVLTETFFLLIEVNQNCIHYMRSSAILLEGFVELNIHVETHRVVRRRGSYIFYAVGSQMAVRLSALPSGRPLPPGRFLVFIPVRG